MFGSLIVVIAFLIALSSALRPSGRGDIITQRPYNNPYNAASAARDGRLL
jgi:hypothetical protein